MSKAAPYNLADREVRGFLDVPPPLHEIVGNRLQPDRKSRVHDDEPTPMVGDLVERRQPNESATVVNDERDVTQPQRLDESDDRFTMHLKIVRRSVARLVGATKAGEVKCDNPTIRRQASNELAIDVAPGGFSMQAKHHLASPLVYVVNPQSVQDKVAWGVGKFRQTLEAQIRRSLEIHWKYSDPVSLALDLVTIRGPIPTLVAWHVRQVRETALSPYALFGTTRREVSKHVTTTTCRRHPATLLDRFAQPPDGSRDGFRLNRANLVFVIAAHVLALGGAMLLMTTGAPWQSYALGLVWFGCCGLSITSGYHRLFAHRASCTHL